MPTADRSRQRRLIVGFGAAAVGVVIVSAAWVSRPTTDSSTPARTGSTASVGLAATGGSGPLTVEAIPAVDPQPWTAVAWREIAGAFGNRLAPGLDRIDGLIAGPPGLVGWGRVHQAGRNQFNDMAAVHLSADGVGWAVIPVDAGVGPTDTSEIQLIATGPAGIVIFGDVCCTKEERRALWRSADGQTWERLPYPAAIGPTDELTRLVATADRYVLAGRSDGAAAIWTSQDGVEWGAVDGAAAGFGAGSIADVARTADGLVAVGLLDVGGTYDGAVWMSPDGDHWKRVVADLLTGNDDTAVEKVVVWAGGWFLIGSEGPHADRVRCEKLGQAGQLASIDSGVDDNSRDWDLSCGWGREVHWLTADGTTWQRVPSAAAPAGGRPKPGELIEFRLVNAGGPGLVVLGEGSDVGAASIFVSADGVNWRVTAPDKQFPDGVVPYGFVVGSRVIAAVADGPSAWIGTVR
jgi:hypothetical protein